MMLTSYTFGYRRVEQDIQTLARQEPYKTARLVSSLEDFVRDGPAELVVKHAVRGREVYLVPPRLALLTVPDAAAVVLVDHDTQTLDIVQIIDTYNGASARQWQGVVAADQAVI